MNVEGERVLITGGWSGIGFAIDRNALAKGAKVVVPGGHEEATTAAVTEFIETGNFEVIRVCETRAKMIAMNRDKPEVVDERLLG